MTKTPRVGPICELGAALYGEALEVLKDIVADPGEDHSQGQLASLGAAFSSIRDQLTKSERLMFPWSDYPEPYTSRHARGTVSITICAGSL